MDFQVGPLNFQTVQKDVYVSNLIPFQNWLENWISYFLKDLDPDALVQDWDFYVDFF